MGDAAADLSADEPRLLHRGVIMDLVSQQVDLGPAGTVVREYLRHPGAVAILALDEQGRVLLLRQYRHPVRAHLWEVPAGLLDVQGEDLVGAAARELAEEADLRAGRWHTLVDYYTSPGASNEAVRIFLARDLSPVPADERHERQAEEAGMTSEWLALPDALDGVLSGRIHNPSTVIAVLAAQVYAGRDWAGLRPADAPWAGRR